MGTMRERQKQVQLYRGQIPSPGRPTVAWREDRARFWSAIARGLKTEEASAEAGVSSPVGFRWFRHAEGHRSRSGQCNGLRGDAKTATCAAHLGNYRLPCLRDKGSVTRRLLEGLSALAIDHAGEWAVRDETRSRERGGPDIGRPTGKEAEGPFVLLCMRRARI